MNNKILFPTKTACVDPHDVSCPDLCNRASHGEGIPQNLHKITHSIASLSVNTGTKIKPNPVFSRIELLGLMHFRTCRWDTQKAPGTFYLELNLTPEETEKLPFYFRKTFGRLSQALTSSARKNNRPNMITQEVDYSSSPTVPVASHFLDIHFINFSTLTSLTKTFDSAQHCFDCLTNDKEKVVVSLVMLKIKEHLILDPPGNHTVDEIEAALSPYADLFIPGMNMLNNAYFQVDHVTRMPG